MAVAAGYLAMTVLLVATQVVLMRFVFHLVPGADLEMPPLYLLANGIVSLFYAVAGGSICAAISKRHEAPTILGALLLGIAIGGVVMHRGGEPIWYTILVPLLEAFAATIAGYHWLGKLPE